MENLTKKELLQIISELRAEIADLKKKFEARISILEAENAALKTENSELKRRLGLNSENSSKSPSSDGLKKKARILSLRTSDGKKSGGQKGHAGETLQQVATPDFIIKHEVDSCPKCQTSLANEPIQKIIKRQVFDIPQSQYFVQEHQVLAKQCPECYENVQGDFPTEVKAPVQYGINVITYAAYLQNQHLIPEKRVREIIQDLCGLSISKDRIAHASRVLSEKLENFETQVEQHVKIAPVKHGDETGFRIAGITHWLHTLSTPEATFYKISEKRKNKIENLFGVFVHDHWKPYFQQTDVQHVLCNAHHLRELKALIEFEKESWAQLMFDLLTFANKKKYEFNGNPPPEIINSIKKSYHDILLQGFAYHENLDSLPKKGVRGRKKRRTGHNLLLRLRDFEEETLRFLLDFNIPFTNNLAEQDLRMMKVKQKISGCFRTLKGAKNFARIRSFLSTARKLKLDIFETLVDAFHGKVFQLSIS